MMQKIIIWLRAARLKLHILGILPVLVGSLIAFDRTGVFRLGSLIFAELITLFVLIATAFSNDYADIETDRENKNFNMFSGGSRLLVEGFISKSEMLIGIIAASFISIALSIMFLLFLNASFAIILFNLIGLFVGIEYSLSPLRINYRGFGEFFVFLMYGIFCLLFGYVSQTGIGFDNKIFSFSIPIGIAVFLIILITEIPDYESDKIFGKKTIPVIFKKETSFLIYLIGMILLYLSSLILYLSGLLNNLEFLGLFFSLPLGVYLLVLSLSKNKTLPKNISTLCGLTIILNVWVNVVLCMGLIF